MVIGNQDVGSQLHSVVPLFDFGHRHELVVGAPRERVYEAADHYRLGESWVIRWLFRLRGLPCAETFRISLSEIGFVVLHEEYGREIVPFPYGTGGVLGRTSSPRGSKWRPTSA